MNCSESNLEQKYSSDNRESQPQNSIQQPVRSSFEKMLEQNGLVNIATIDSSIVISLKYSTKNNIAKRDMYKDFDKAYLQEDVAVKLKNAQQYIKRKDSSLSLIVFDAVRPHSIQQLLWDSVALPIKKKRRFLAHPNKYSLHNFGAAVDVSLVKNKSELLDMGTPFDYPNELAYPCLENYFVSIGELSIDVIKNRTLLRNAMIEAGFIDNKYEWWHFSACRRTKAIATFALIKTFHSVEKPDTIRKIFEEHDVWFKVQLAAATRALPKKHKIFNAPNVKMYTHEGMFKYTTGEFKDLSKTYTYRDSLRNEGFQAFVVCFDNGERIHIQEAIYLTSQ